jgi:hypothetical protein
MIGSESPRIIRFDQCWSCRTQSSATSRLANHCLFDAALERIEDQTGYEPSKRDMLLLSNLTEVGKQIVGQDNGEFGFGFQDSRSLVIDNAV